MVIKGNTTADVKSRISSDASKANLLDDVNTIMRVLQSQHSMQVIQKNSEMKESIPDRHNYCQSR